jgi:hypothetical protein
MAAIETSIGTEPIGSWSGGCQAIAGQKNWTEFITNAWTRENDPVDYFLVDARDIDPRVWSACVPDGSHECPLGVDALPFEHSALAAETGGSRFTEYNCRPQAAMPGPEVIYRFTTDASGTVSVTVEGPGDAFLLDGNDPRACIAWHEGALVSEIVPGRYLVVVDGPDAAPKSPFTVKITFASTP